MAKNDVFDKSIILKYIGREFQKLMWDMTQDELSEKTNTAQSTINRILNWDLPVSRDKLWQIAEWLWMTEAKFQNLMVEAKVHEIETTSGKELWPKGIDEVIAEEFDVDDPEDIKKMIDVLHAMSSK